MKYWLKIAVALAFVGASTTAAVAFTAPATTDGATVRASADGATHPDGVARRRPGRLGRRMVTGEFKVQTKDGFATVRVDQGTVTAVTPGSLTLERADGQSVTVPVNADTKIAKDGNTHATLTDIETGDLVRTQQVNTGDGFTTRGIRARSPSAAGSADAAGSSDAPPGAPALFDL